MANEGVTLPSRFGEIAGGTVFDIFNRIFAGEVLTAFHRDTVFRGRTRMKTITHGKSAQFPVIGTASAVYRTLGQNIIQEGGATPTYLQGPGSQQKIIHVDHPLICPILVDEFDELLSDFEVRGPFAQEIGSALALRWDRNMGQVCAVAAEAGATLTGEGSWGKDADPKITSSDFETNLATLKDVIRDAAGRLDQNHAPKNDRHMILHPTVYRRLASDAAVEILQNPVHVGTGTGGTQAVGGFPNPAGLLNNNFVTGTIAMYQGFMIWPSLLVGNQSGAVGEVTTLGTGGTEAQQRGAEYTVDFSDLVGLYWQKQGLGAVERQSVTTSISWHDEYQSHLLLGKLVAGMGSLHTHWCGAIYDS